MFGENSKNMRILCTKWLVLPCLLLIAPLVRSQEFYQKLTDEGIELGYNLHFDGATKIFNRLIEMEPEDPRGYLLQSVNFYYRYQLEENHGAFSEQFVKLSKSAIEAAERRLNNAEQKLDAMFYLGTAHMYLAAYYGWESEWMKAYWYGRKGISYLERLVQLDPTYYDAYLGLGLYHYYTDVIPKLARPITFLLGLEPDRKKGLSELELAAKKGRYSQAEALLFLGSINLYIEKDYRKSLAYLEQLTELYPENASYLMLLGENYEKVGRNELALETLDRLVRDAGASRFPVLVISSYFRLGNLYYNQRELPTAIQNYQKALKHASESTGNVDWVFALANLNLGRSFDLLGRRDEALQYYRRVQKSDHKHAYEVARKRIKKPLVRSKLASRTRNHDEIMEMYQDAVAKARAVNASTEPLSMAELYYYVGREFYDRDIYNLAIRKFTKVVGMQNMGKEWIRPWAQFYLGKCYVKTGKFEEAQASLAAAYDHDDAELRSEIDGFRATIPSKSVN